MSVLALVRSSSEANAADIQQMKQKMVDYWNAVATINANSFAIARTTLTPIDDRETPPEWWTSLSQNFADCRSHAQVWIDTVYPSLTRVPQAIVSYNTFFGVTSDSIIAELKRITAGKPTAEQKQSIQNKLNLLLNRLNVSKAQVKSVRTDIKAFTDNLDEDRTALTDGTANVTAAITVEKASIAKINRLIEDLRNDIASYGMAIGIGTVAGTTAISIGFALGGPFGLVVGLIGVGASIATIAVFSQKIAAASQRIAEETDKLGPRQRRVIALNTIDGSVKSLTTAIDAINTNIDVVTKTWEGLEEGLGGLIQKLTAARDEDWSDLIQKGIDLGGSKEAWRNLAAFATELQRMDVTFDSTVYTLEGVA